MTFASTFGSFNRKEHDLLAHWLMNDRGGSRLSLSLHGPVVVPGHARLYIDQHLDWVVAELLCHAGLDDNVPFDNSFDGERYIAGTQTDIDALFVWDDSDGESHLLLIEAKADGPWDLAQLQAKAVRIELIRRVIEAWTPGIHLHVVLVSPDRVPQRIRAGVTGLVCSAPWVELPTPAGRRYVGRTDAAGQRKKDGEFFTITAVNPTWGPAVFRGPIAR